MSEQARADLYSQQGGSTTAWFEQVYSQAGTDTDQIPWAKLGPHPQLQNWLSGKARCHPGQTSLVVGCGLGDDAEILADRGWQVTAFDVSPTAIARCRARFPASAVDYQVAELLQLAARGGKTYDLVLESRTIQSLPLTVREPVSQAIASLVAPRGTLLVICALREADDTIPAVPPWPLSEAELSQFSTFGLQEINRTPFLEKEMNQLCVEYQKQ